MNTIEVVELQRERWARLRQSFGLTDRHAASFNAGGLAPLSSDANVRLLILPADPAGVAAAFDDDFWNWWMEDRDNPFEGAHRTDWGSECAPTHDAAVRFDRRRTDQWAWDDYLALHRSGALEFGIDACGIWNQQGSEQRTRVFFLTTIVGRVWWSLALYTEVVDRYELVGPWEVTLAFRDTEGSVLGNVAAGWAEPAELWPREPSTCLEPNVLLTSEAEAWPSNRDEVQSLAFDLGGRIEDAWRVRQRRFLSRIDPDIGTFDVSRYRYR